jgi:hypothetical protein
MAADTAGQDPPEDLRKTSDASRTRTGPQTASGSGAAYGQGYGAGGLGSGAFRAGQTGADQPGANSADPSWDAPGVTPDGRRTGSSTDGPRVAMDGEAEPSPDLPSDTDED